MRRTRLPIAILLLLTLSPGQNPDTRAGRPDTLAIQRQASSRLAPPDYQADFTPVVANGSHAVSWNHGHLVSFSIGEIKEPVTSWDKTGKWLFEDRLSFENAVRTYIQDGVATSWGTAVIAASVLNSDGASADLIVEIGKEGIRRVIRTSPFYPIKVCATQEGIVWAYGKELTADRSAEPRAQYPMLREYSLEKGELRAALDRSTVRPPSGVPVSGSREELQLRCNSHKLVLLSGPTKELIEYDLAASELSRWPLASLPDGVDVTRVTGAALTDSGEVYISTYDAPNLKALTRILEIHLNSTGTADWIPIAAIPSQGKWFVLLGSDGDHLVYSRGRGSPTLFWSKPEREVAK